MMNGCGPIAKATTCIQTTLCLERTMHVSRSRNPPEVLVPLSPPWVSLNVLLFWNSECAPFVRGCVVSVCIHMSKACRRLYCPLSNSRIQDFAIDEPPTICMCDGLSHLIVAVYISHLNACCLGARQDSWMPISQGLPRSRRTTTITCAVRGA